MCKKLARTYFEPNAPHMKISRILKFELISTVFSPNNPYMPLDSKPPTRYTFCDKEYSNLKSKRRHESTCMFKICQIASQGQFGAAESTSGSDSHISSGPRFSKIRVQSAPSAAQEHPLSP